MMDSRGKEGVGWAAPTTHLGFHPQKVDSYAHTVCLDLGWETEYDSSTIGERDECPNELISLRSCAGREYMVFGRA